MKRPISRDRTRVAAAFCCTALLAGLAAGPSPAAAAEAAQSFYTLGLHGPLAAVAPPPGVYLQNDTMIYAGKASASEQLPFSGRVTAGVKANAYLDLPTLLWQTPLDIGGVRVGLTVTQPFGAEYVVGRIITTRSETTTQGTRFAAGDLAVSMPLTWSRGRLNLAVIPSLNIPTGNYEVVALSNVALHRWAGDIAGAVTWLDKQSGIEASAIAGVTLNGTNPATYYRTGTEVHAEAALSQYFSASFSVGALLGYYQQVTSDTGLGAVLGDFKGRVWAAGATASYLVPVAGKPVALRAKVLREFAVQNRLAGTTGVLSAGVGF